MQIFLMQIAQMVMGFKSLIGAEAESGPIENVEKQTWYKNTFLPVIDVIDQMLLPIIILLGTAGTIYAIVLGVNFVKAEDAGKREEAKKRMINAIIGIVITLVLLILMKLLTANADAIADWVNGITNKHSTGTK